MDAAGRLSARELSGFVWSIRFHRVEHRPNLAHELLKEEKSRSETHVLLGKAGGTVTAGEPSLPLLADHIPTLPPKLRTLRDASGPAVNQPAFRA